MVFLLYILPHNLTALKLPYSGPSRVWGQSKNEHQFLNSNFAHKWWHRKKRRELGWTRPGWFDSRLIQPIRMGLCVVELKGTGFPPSLCELRENKEDGVTASKGYPLIMRLNLFSGPLNGCSKTAQTINSIYFTLRAPVCVCCSFGLAFFMPLRMWCK